MLESLKRNNRVYAGKRVGRGYGSGKGGHYSGRGGKGQTARSGHKSTLFFEGGNVPFFRRLPKYRGQNNPNKIEARAVNLIEIEKAFENGEVVSLLTLREKNLARKSDVLIKILSHGVLTKKLTFEGLKMSKVAQEKIQKSGGEVK